jgi:hypothetical protein
MTLASRRRSSADSAHGTSASPTSEALILTDSAGPPSLAEGQAAVAPLMTSVGVGPAAAGASPMLDRKCSCSWYGRPTSQLRVDTTAVIARRTTARTTTATLVAPSASPFAPLWSDAGNPSEGPVASTLTFMRPPPVDAGCAHRHRSIGLAGCRSLPVEVQTCRGRSPPMVTSRPSAPPLRRRPSRKRRTRARCHHVASVGEVRSSSSAESLGEARSVAGAGRPDRTCCVDVVPAHFWGRCVPPPGQLKTGSLGVGMRFQIRQSYGLGRGAAMSSASTGSTPENAPVRRKPADW